MLVQSKKAYALRDNEGMEFILELSDNRCEQQSLPIYKYKDIYLHILISMVVLISRYVGIPGLIQTAIRAVG